MARYSFATYSIKVYEANNRPKPGDNSGYLPLDSLGGKKLSDVIYKSLSALQRFDKLEAKHLTCQVTQLQQSDDGCSISGRFETGEYGQKSEIKDSNTGTKVATLEKAHVVPRSFYFRFFLPRSQKFGVLVLERQKTMGIRTILCAHLVDAFEANVGDLKLDISPVMPASVASELVNREGNRVTAIRFIKHGIADDLADKANASSKKKDYGIFEVVYRIGRGKSFKQEFLKDLFTSAEAMASTGVFEYSPPDARIPDVKFETVKLEYAQSAAVRTVDVSHLTRMRATFPIDDCLDFGDDAHPTFESLEKEAKRFTNTFAIHLNGSKVMADK